MFSNEFDNRHYILLLILIYIKREGLFRPSSCQRNLLQSSVEHVVARKP